MVKQAQIDNYIMGALAFIPTLTNEQLIAMAMLHYCTFYDETKAMVETALKSIHISAK